MIDQIGNIKIIGLGGVGSILCDFIARYLDNNNELENKLVLIDGDEYETKNVDRQLFSRLGPKSMIKTYELFEKFNNLDASYLTQFVNEENVSDLINDSDLIFLCVDNHKTRNIVDNYCKSLDNVVLISGGNEFVDGNVQIYIRKDGKDIFPSLTDTHPEIFDYTDKSPDEMSCEELESVSPQLIFTNLTVATIMLWYFYNLVRGHVDKCETYFDLEMLAVNSVIRKPKN